MLINYNIMSRIADTYNSVGGYNNHNKLLIIITVDEDHWRFDDDYFNNIILL